MASTAAPLLEANGVLQPQQPTATMAGQNMSADEIALYDRQIRLWGVQAQEKIRTANILLIGMKGLANEVAKNLVLAGIGSLTIVDDGEVTEDDLGAQFFIREEHVGKNRARAALPQIQKLNPRVTITTTSLDSLFADSTIFGVYSLVIATDMSLQDSSMVNAACRVQGRPFYAAGTHGMYGYIFVDLITHDFVISRTKSNVETTIGPESATRSIIGTTTSRGTDGKVTELVTKREIYSPLLLANTSPLPAFHLATRRRKANVTPVLSCFRALWDFQKQTSRNPGHSGQDIALFTTLATTKHNELMLPRETLKAEVLRSFLQGIGSEVSPICAFLGGQLAQDVINVMGGKEQPIQNILVFDGEETKGPVYALHSDMTLAMGTPILSTLDAMPLTTNGLDMPMAGMPMVPSMTANMPMAASPGIPGPNPQGMIPSMPNGNVAQTTQQSAALNGSMPPPSQ